MSLWSLPDGMNTSAWLGFGPLYCLTIAAALIWNHRKHVQFYKWFDTVEESSDRGFGAKPCLPYGCMPRPPRLSPAKLEAAGYVLIVTLLYSAYGLAYDTPMALPALLTGFGLSILYYSQLYAECICSGHGTILIPTCLFYLALAGDGDASCSNQLLKVFIASTYCASGICKLICCFKFRKNWADGAAFQFYIYESIWSRPSQFAPFKWLQRLVVRHIGLCSLMSYAALGLELFFPVALLGPVPSLLFAGVAIKFHVGTFFLLGLDFYSYWAPAIFVFLLEPSAVQMDSCAAAEWRQVIPGGLFTLTQLVVAFGSLYSGWTNCFSCWERMLPFTCCPMFQIPRNIFDKWPKCFSLHRTNTRHAGNFEPLHWSPFSTDFSSSLIHSLPYQSIWFGQAELDKNSPAELAESVKSQFKGEKHLELSNHDIPSELQELLRQVTATMSRGKPSDAWSPSKIDPLLELQDKCLKIFHSKSK